MCHESYIIHELFVDNHTNCNTITNTPPASFDL